MKKKTPARKRRGRRKKSELEDEALMIESSNDSLTDDVDDIQDDFDSDDE